MQPACPVGGMWGGGMAARTGYAPFEPGGRTVHRRGLPPTWRVVLTHVKTRTAGCVPNRLVGLCGQKPGVGGRINVPLRGGLDRDGEALAGKELLVELGPLEVSHEHRCRAMLVGIEHDVPGKRRAEGREFNNGANDGRHVDRNDSASRHESHP